MTPIVDRIRASEDLMVLFLDAVAILDKDHTLPSPDKILCHRTIDRAEFLAPASPAIGLVIRHRLAKGPTPEELRRIVQLEMARAEGNAL